MKKKKKKKKKKKRKTLSAETFFLHQLRLFPADYSNINCTYLCTSSESGSPVTSILLWLVNQIIPVHRN